MNFKIQMLVKNEKKYVLASVLKAVLGIVFLENLIKMLKGYIQVRKKYTNYMISKFYYLKEIQPGYILF